MSRTTKIKPGMTEKQIIRVIHNIGSRAHPHRYQRSQVSQVHHTINRRARIKAEITAYDEGGKIAFYRQGMDCDCSKYFHAQILDTPGVVEFDSCNQKHIEWLDGPESCWFGRASECEPAYESRDLALEAFEEGHPHVVYY